MIIAVDFDGTIVEDAYPGIGREREGATETLRRLRSEGYSLILWTCRTDKLLAEAVLWCAERGIRFSAINGAMRHQVVQYNSDSRKIGASIYIDDKGVAPLPSWAELYEIIHERVPTYADKIAGIEPDVMND